MLYDYYVEFFSAFAVRVSVPLLHSFARNLHFLATLVCEHSPKVNCSLMITYSQIEACFLRETPCLQGVHMTAQKQEPPIKFGMQSFPLDFSGAAHILGIKHVRKLFAGRGCEGTCLIPEKEECITSPFTIASTKIKAFCYLRPVDGLTTAILSPLMTSMLLGLP